MNGACDLSEPDYRDDLAKDRRLERLRRLITAEQDISYVAVALQTIMDDPHTDLSVKIRLGAIARRAHHADEMLRERQEMPRR
jgi:hypothetical protein